MENTMGGIFENFMRQSIFNRSSSRGNSVDEEGKHKDASSSPKSIPQLSPLANSVVARCSKILLISSEELQHRFETELPDHVKQPSSYARNLIEFCSYKTLHVATLRPDFLSDKEFRRLTYDMMIAWEAPGLESEPLLKETAPQNNKEVDDEDGWSLFYSNSMSMAVQVDHEKTVGPEAFARIAPACAAIADIITVHNLFEVLTSSSSGRLHFLIYDKYLGCLDKVIKTAKHASGPPLCSNLQLAEGEIIIDVDGTNPIQPVLQHIGMSAWPGKLTLTNYALYFESGVGIHDKAVRYDLAMDLKQVVKPDLTGPLGTRLFDKAVVYKSTSVAEPVYFEFPEFKYNSRRDSWLEIILEILHAHRFVRKYKLKETQQVEALAKAALGIFRHQAVREAFHIFPSHYNTLLDYNLAEKLPRGDTILETLASRIDLLTTRNNPKFDGLGTPLNCVKRRHKLSPISLSVLTGYGFMLPRGADAVEDPEILVGDVCVGETNPLEMAVKQLKCDAGKAEAAQATVDKVKLEGIDTNIAVMKDLLYPVVELVRRLHFLASWEDPFKSTLFLVLISYTIYRRWIKYLLPCSFVLLAALMLWRKHRNKGKPLEAFRVTPPPSKNAVEQLLTLQEAISQFEALVQDGNIILLKLRALLFAALPQATDKVALLLIFMAVMFAYLSLKTLLLLMLLEAYTREMPLRKDTNERWLRRVREWWFRIPAAPVQLIRGEDSKKKKK